MTNSNHQYVCQYVGENQDIPWSDLTTVTLVETTTEEQPKLHTEVKSCWTDDGLHVRFICEDDHVMATYTERDDPLYEQDVVEVFIDEQGDGRNYMEFELSPRNVLFDALIENDLEGSINVNAEWDAAGIHTHVQKKQDHLYIYDIVFPHHIFAKAPQNGDVWKINFYRIDEDPEGRRSYMAWSPTGKNNFHIPQAFGSLVFSD